MATQYTECNRCKHYIAQGAQGLCGRYPPNAMMVNTKDQETGEVRQITISYRPPVTLQRRVGSLPPQSWLTS